MIINGKCQYCETPREFDEECGCLEDQIEQLTKLVYHLIQFTKKNSFPTGCIICTCDLYFGYHEDDCPYPDYEDLIREVIETCKEEEDEHIY